MSRKVQIPDEIGIAAERAALADGKTLDELVTDAVKHELGRRWMDKLKHEGNTRRGSLSDTEVEALVDEAIRADRIEQRSR